MLTSPKSNSDWLWNGNLICIWWLQFIKSRNTKKIPLPLPSSEYLSVFSWFPALYRSVALINITRTGSSEIKPALIWFDPCWARRQQWRCSLLLLSWQDDPDGKTAPGLVGLAEENNLLRREIEVLSTEVARLLARAKTAEKSQNFNSPDENLNISFRCTDFKDSAGAGQESL